MAYKFVAALALAFVASSEEGSCACACVHPRSLISASAARTARLVVAPNTLAATDNLRAAAIRDIMDARACCSLGRSAHGGFGRCPPTDRIN